MVVVEREREERKKGMKMKMRVVVVVARPSDIFSRAWKNLLDVVFLTRF